MRPFATVTRQGLVVLGLGLLLFMAARPLQGAEPLEVRWSYRLSPHNAILVDNKFGERYGVTIKSVMFKTGVEARDGLIAGAIDVGELGVTPTITALSRAQKDLVVIAVQSFGGGQYRVVVNKRSPIQTMEELRGKRIAIKVGSGNYTAFLMWAASKGYDIKDFQVNDVGETEALSAMEAGSVDAVVYWEPIPAILVSKGLAREIFDFSGYVQNPTYLVARRDFLKKSPQAAIRFLAGWIDSLAFIQFNVQEAARMSAEVLNKRGINISVEAYRLALGHQVFEPWLYPTLMKETIETYHFLVKDGKAPASIDWKTAFDPTYLAEASKLVVQETMVNVK